MARCRTPASASASSVPSRTSRVSPTCATRSRSRERPAARGTDAIISSDRVCVRGRRLSAHVTTFAGSIFSNAILAGERSMQLKKLRRRDVITLAGAAVAWPLAARAQQPAMPVVGFLDPTAPDAATADRLRSFGQGLRDAGFIEGENVTIEYRWADSRIDRLSVLAAGFVRRQVGVIVATGGSTPAFAAKAETSTIPIVFTAAQDPVKLGLVASLAKPGGNMTGVFLPAEQTVRRLGVLRELVPAAKRIAVLLDPSTAMDFASIVKEIEAAAGRTSGLQVKVVNASTDREIDAAFESFGRERPDALLVGPFSTDRRGPTA